MFPKKPLKCWLKALVWVWSAERIGENKPFFSAYLLASLPAERRWLGSEGCGPGAPCSFVLTELTSLPTLASLSSSWAGVWRMQWKAWCWLYAHSIEVGGGGGCQLSIQMQQSKPVSWPEWLSIWWDKVVTASSLFCCVCHDRCYRDAALTAISCTSSMDGACQTGRMSTCTGALWPGPILLRLFCIWLSTYGQCSLQHKFMLVGNLTFTFIYLSIVLQMGVICGV